MSGDALLLPMDSLFEVPGRLVVLQQEVPYRFLPYLPGSQQAKKGQVGRWQAFVGNRWINAQPKGFGWRHPLEGELPDVSATEG